jgi:hypothetical protein
MAAGARALVPSPFIVVVFLLLAAAARDASALTRHDFPEGFVFGAGTSAFQVPSTPRLISQFHLTLSDELCYYLCRQCICRYDIPEIWQEFVASDLDFCLISVSFPVCMA